MEHLWSPWRLAYITGASQSTGAVFFAAPSPTPTRIRSSSTAAATCFVILNLFPYNNGHLMVIPNRHIASLTAATADELRELIELTRTCEIALTEAYAPHGMNMGINLGKPAGAGVLDHVHMHVVPRWNGDTQLHDRVGRTRVLARGTPRHRGASSGRSSSGSLATFAVELTVRRSPRQPENLETSFETLRTRRIP